MSGPIIIPLLLALLTPWEVSLELPDPRLKPLVLTFTGDIMAHEVNFQMSNFDDIYAGVKDVLQSDDLTFGNLETPVDRTKPFQTYPTFNVHPSYAAAAVKAGFDVFSLANNHTNDQGEASMDQTVESLELLTGLRPLIWHGIRSKKGHPEPVAIRTVEGVRIGLLSVTSLLNANTGKEKIEYYPYANFYNGTVREDLVRALEDRVREAARACDVLVVGFHDGLEYVKKPFPAQKEVYRRLIRAGASILWAHHPHVLLPYETVEEGGRQGLIMYSLGNFISGQTWGLQPSQATADRARTGDGVLIQVKLYRTPRRIIPQVDRVIPLNNYRHPQKGMITGPTEFWAAHAHTAAWRAYFQTRLEAQQALFSLEGITTP